MRNCNNQFHVGEKVMSLVSHPPEIESGTEAKIVSPWFGSLYAVKLPNGELHRWFAEFELQAVNPGCSNYIRVGDYATITSVKGHPPMIKEGMVVQIVKVIYPAVYYDLYLEDNKYHRWLAEFEIAHII